jgi:hypothetical protein
MMVMMMMMMHSSTNCKSSFLEFLRKRVVLDPHPTTGKTLHGDNNKRYLLATLPQTFWTPFLVCSWASSLAAFT